MSTLTHAPEPTHVATAAVPRSSSPGYTVTLAVLVAVAATYGLVAGDAYRSVRPLLQETWRAQDAVTLATLPLLLVAAARARAGSFRWHVVAVGIHTWLAYCYAHLAVGTPFNDVFLVYVAVLVMAGFAMLDGLLRVDVRPVAASFSAVPHGPAAWFLGVAGLGIAGLWLSDVVPGLVGDLPREVHLADLPNPTWVLDLGWIIPVSIAAAVMARRRHPATALLAGSLLVMLLVLSLAMLVVTPLALTAGLGDDPAVGGQLVAFTVVFTVLGGVEAWLLAAGARRSTPPSHWRRDGWWAGASTR